MPHKLFWVSTRISSHTHTHGKHKYLNHTARRGQGTVTDAQHTELESCRDKLYFQGDFSGNYKPAMPLENRLANRYFNTAEFTVPPLGRDKHLALLLTLIKKNFYHGAPK